MDFTPSKIVSDDVLLRVHLKHNSDAHKTAEEVGLSVSQVRKRLQRIRLLGHSQRPHLFERADDDAVKEDGTEKKNRLEKLLDDSNIDVHAVGRIGRVRIKSYGGYAKVKQPDGTETIETVPLFSTSADLYQDSPEFPLIQPAEPTKIVYNEAPRILRKVHQGIVISDAQIGYMRSIETGLLDTIHDVRAMEVARQITGSVAPEALIFIGDWVDFNWISRWQKRPEFFGVAQPAIQAGYVWKARFVAAAPKKSKKIEIGSNHQVRPEQFILEYNRESLGLTRAKRPGDKTEWPVFSEPFLLRYDDLGIEFSGQYPGGEYFLLNDLCFMHAPPKKAEFAAHVIHGHTHKLGTAQTHVVHSRDGRAEFLTWDSGCLCRTDATTDKKRLMVTSVPSDRGRTDWLQGIIHFEWIEFGGGTKHQIHPIHIFDGHALYAGQEFAAPDGYNEDIISEYGYDT